MQFLDSERIGLAALALLTAALLLGAGLLGLRARADDPVSRAAPAAAAPADTLRVYVDPPTSSVPLGETLVLSVAIEGAEDLLFYSFDLSWDPAVFTFVSAQDAGFLEEPTMGSALLNPAGAPTGTVRVQRTTFKEGAVGVSGDGVLATVSLQATGGGTSTLHLHRVRLRDAQGLSTPPDVVDDGWTESTGQPVNLVAIAANAPVELGQAVHFTATVTGSPPISYTWDFGGPGAASAEQTATPSYVYDALGLYTATVTVTNPWGVDQGAIGVRVTCDTVQIIDLASDGPVELGEPIHFTAAVAGAQPITYTWDFDGDGSPDLAGVGLDVVTHTYTATGAYTPTLTVDNRCGVEEQAALPVRVTGVGELARIQHLTAGEPALPGQPVPFTATVSGAQPITYTWDFDSDGDPEQVGPGLDVVTHTYAAAGPYTVTLHVENVWNQDTRELTLSVCEPVSIVSLTADSPVTPGEATYFTATVSGTRPITYSWDFDGDGTPDLVGPARDVVTHTYAAPGTYTATLHVENGCPSQATEAVVVTVEEPCQAAAIVSLIADSPVKVGETIHFTAVVTGTEPITYTWDVDSDGSPEHVGLGLDVVTHTYAAAGTYTVTLHVENACGADTLALPVKVERYEIFLPLVLRTGG